MSDFFRGDDNAKVTVFDVIQAIHVGQVDRETLTAMMCEIGVDVCNLANKKDAELLFAIVNECGTEAEFECLFKDTYEFECLFKDACNVHEEEEVNDDVVPKFQSNWTKLMADWLAMKLNDCNSIGDSESLYEADEEMSRAERFLVDHWEEICESWGCKDKWDRIMGCLEKLDWLQKELHDRLYKMTECWAKGHEMVDVSEAGPDYGNMDHKCSRCGRHWHVPLY